MFKYFSLFSKMYLLIFLISASTGLFAQNNYALVAGGFNFAKPILQNGYTSDWWKGVHIRSKYVEFGYMSARVIDPLEKNVLGTNAYLGANIPIRKLGIGKRVYGIKGFLLIPFIAGDIGRTSIGAAHSFQGTIAPGVSLQLPYVLIDFRMNTGVTFNNVAGLKNHKLLLMPTIAFQFDALFDIMDPKIKFNGTFSGTTTSTTYSESTEHYTDYDIVTTTATTSSSSYSYDTYKKDVGPHISLGPRVCYWSKAGGKKYINGESLMFGLVQSGRAHGFGYDLIGETGSIHTSDGPELKQTRAIGRFLYDFNVSKTGLTHWVRLMGGLGLGYNWFEKSDLATTQQNGQFINLSVSLEFGAVSFTFEKNFGFYSVFDNQRYFAFTYRVPFEKVHDRYKEMRESR
ncbi:hypothetical protein BH09BAC5_BH09BAC5_09610 [soil metagenome]